MKNWYIIQSHSSFENKVAQEIKEEASKANLLDKIEEIIVPTHDITEVKRGKRVQRKKKYFPGYVLLKSEMDNTLYHMIKNLQKVSGFLGSSDKPTPISDEEIKNQLCSANPYKEWLENTQIILEEIDSKTIEKRRSFGPSHALFREL